MSSLINAKVNSADETLQVLVRCVHYEPEAAVVPTNNGEKAFGSLTAPKDLCFPEGFTAAKLNMSTPQLVKKCNDLGDFS